MVLNPHHVLLSEYGATSSDVLSPKKRAMLSDTLRRLVFVKLNWHLVPHNSLSETDRNTLEEIDEKWVQSITVATEQ
jgi:hypothetical protein